jgi:hypothetical protein
MTIDDFVAIGFEHRLGFGFDRRGDGLHAPDGSAVCFVPLDARCFRLVITMPNGGTVSAVVAALALKIEGAKQ